MDLINRRACEQLAIAVAFAVIASVAAPLPVRAQAQGGSGATSTSGLDEIVVFARKREESLQETPIAISAFSGEELGSRSLTNLMEVGSYVPNVTMATGQGGSGGGNNGQVYIRGIGQIDFLFTTDPGVGIYIDGVFHPRTLGASMDLLDLERVEVLRGPQGTLFGKNTVGGAINVISKKPTGEFGGYGEVTLGRFDRTDFRGSIDFPLAGDTLAGKISVSYKKRDSFGKRRDFATGRTLDETGDEDQIGLRAAIRWQASEDVTVDLSADYSKWDQESVGTQLLGFDDTGVLGGGLGLLYNALVPGPGGLPISSAFVSGDEDTSFGTGPNHNELDAWGVNATVAWDMGFATLTSITAYREMEAVFGRDGDGSPLSYVHTDQDQDQDQFSQELQLGGTAFEDRLEWVVGAFYFDEFGRDTNDVRLASGLFGALEALPGAFIPLTPTSVCPGAFPPNVCAGGAGNPFNITLDLDFDIFNEIDIESVAGFAQGTFAVTEQLSVTGGARYTYETKEYFLVHRRVNSGAFIIPDTTVKDRWSEATYTASVQYEWNEELMTYFTFSRGFKSGGFNGRPTNQGEVQSFDPEFLDSYELGLKSEWFERRLRLNLAGFFYDYEDLQFTAVTADPADGTLLLVVDNVATAEVQGFELELVARPMEGLDLTAAVGYTDFEVTDVDPSVSDVTTNTEMVRTPEWTASASIEYTLPWDEHGAIRIRTDWTYEDQSFSDVQNTPLVARDSSHIINARVTWEAATEFWGGGWQLAVFGTNLTDKRVLVNGLQALSPFGTAEGFFNRPREWGVSVRKSF